MINTIIQEIALRQHEISSPIETIYFGGGTPSVLSDNELNRIFESLHRYFDLSKVSEVTLEANPDDLTKAYLRHLQNSPINRLSIGVQSFYDIDLKLMNRAHKAIDAENCIQNAQDTGFQNLTIDLIYGSSTTTDQMWHNNLQKAIDLQIPHISSYALTVEDKTQLDFDIKSGKTKPINEEHQLKQFEYLQQFLRANNFVQYEISNFAKNGCFALHNSNYWKSKKYLGFGPSAHSFDGRCRKWNIANNALYIKSIKQNILPSEGEVLSEKDLYNEMVMIGLRTIWGIDENYILTRFSNEIIQEFQNSKQKLIAQKLLIQNKQFIKIPENKKFYTDGIASRLFYV